MAESENEFLHRERVFRIAKRMIALKQEMWVSPEQFVAYWESGKFTRDDMKFLIIVDPWPYPDDTIKEQADADKR